MKKLFILSGFILGNFSILLVSFLFLTVYTTKGSSADILPAIETVDSIADGETKIIIEKPAADVSLIKEYDARAELIDKYFQKYGSPLIGLGKDIVTAADRYQIPYNYLPAIAACEGSLGTAIPYNSYNTWGWGIYGDLVTTFPSWQDAIETVSKGLKEDYFNLGLDTPEKIMPKYTPPSKGTWAICVSQYLQELL